MGVQRGRPGGGIVEIVLAGSTSLL
jgi:hypothetical protein